MKFTTLAFVIGASLASSQQYLVPQGLKDDNYHEISTDLTVEEANGKYFFGLKFPLADSTSFTFGVKYDNGQTTFVSGPGCDTPHGDCSLASSDVIPWSVGDIITFGVVQDGDNDLRLLAGIQTNETAGESFTETVKAKAHLSTFEVLQNNVDAEGCPGKTKSVFTEIRYVTKDVIRELPGFGDVKIVSDANDLECSRNRYNYAIAVDSYGKVALGSGLDSSNVAVPDAKKVPVGSLNTPEDAGSDGDSTVKPVDELADKTTQTTTNETTQQPVEKTAQPADASNDKPEQKSYKTPDTPSKAQDEDAVYVPSAVTTEIGGKQTTFVTVVKGTADDSAKGKALKTLAPLYTMFGEW